MPRLRLLRSIPHNRQELSTVSVENQAVITRAPHPKTGNGLPRAAALTRRPRKDGKEDRAPSTEKKCARRKRQSGSEITRARRLSRSTTAKHACTENMSPIASPPSIRPSRRTRDMGSRSERASWTPTSAPFLTISFSISLEFLINRQERQKLSTSQL